MNANPPHTKPLRQNLRRNLTPAERILWQRIRNKQLGVKFRRQHGIGPYIVDFYCAECSFVIELDGETHFNSFAYQYDHKREAFMRSAGIRILRFTNGNIAENIEGVIAMIADVIIANAKSTRT